MLVCEYVYITTVRLQHVNVLLITTGFIVVSVLTLGCDDSMIVDAFREVLSMLDEVCGCHR